MPKCALHPLNNMKTSRILEQQIHVYNGLEIGDHSWGTIIHCSSERQGVEMREWMTKYHEGKNQHDLCVVGGDENRVIISFIV